MNAEEERLSRLLKRVVPELPTELSADRVTTRPADRSAKSWALPALTSAAVLAIGVTIGVVTSHHAGPALPTASGASTHPQPTVSCQGATVGVPNVIGTTQDAAEAIVQGAGLNAGIYDAVPPAAQLTVPVRRSSCRRNLPVTPWLRSTNSPDCASLKLLPRQDDDDV